MNFKEHYFKALELSGGVVGREAASYIHELKETNLRQEIVIGLAIEQERLVKDGNIRLKRVLKSLVSAYDISLNREMKRVAMEEAKEVLREDHTGD